MQVIRSFLNRVIAKNCLFEGFLYDDISRILELKIMGNILSDSMDRSFSTPSPLLLQSECRKIWTRKTRNTDNFHAATVKSMLSFFQAGLEFYRTQNKHLFSRDISHMQQLINPFPATSLFL